MGGRADAIVDHTGHRCTVRDYERLAAHHETYIYWAMIVVMTRRLARQPQPKFSSRLLLALACK